MDKNKTLVAPTVCLLLELAILASNCVKLRVRYQLILGKVFPFSLQISCEIEQLRLESSHGVLLNIQSQN